MKKRYIEMGIEGDKSTGLVVIMPEYSNNQEELLSGYMHPTSVRVFLEIGSYTSLEQYAENLINGNFRRNLDALIAELNKKNYLISG